VLPGGYEPLTEFFNFCKEVLHLDDDQVIYTSGKTYNLDDDIDEEVVSKLKAIVGSAQEDHFALVPYSTTDNFNRWASQITALHASVIGDDAEWVKKFGHKGILHRHIRTPDQPSIIEELGVNVKVAKGYVCSTVEDLLDAYKAIGTSEVVIKPNFGAAGEGIIFVSEEEQLKLYDFPMGDVLLEEKLNLDKASDGIVLSPAVHYMESKLVGKALVDQIMVGTGYAGWRPSVAPKVFQDFASRLTRKLVGKLEPRGPGGFDFLSVEGEPILSDVNTGRFNGAHFPKIFREMYAPDKEFFVWKVDPPKNLDIWKYWSRLVDKKAAFIPGQSERGVFPLIYLRGLSGLFIAIDDTKEKAEAWKKTSDSVLVPPKAESLRKYSHFMKSDIVKKSGSRYWLPNDLKFGELDERVVSLLPLSILRPYADYIEVVEAEGVHEYIDFAVEVQKLQSEQVFTFSDDHSGMDSSIMRIEEAQQNMTTAGGSESDSRLVVVPFRVDNSLQKRAEELKTKKVGVFGDELDRQSAQSGLKLIYRHIDAPDQPSLVEQASPGTVISKGYICSDNKGLLKAYDKLNEESVVLRPVNSASAENIVTISCKEELKLVSVTGDFVVEAAPMGDKARDGIPIIAAVTYLGDTVFGDCAQDLVFLGNSIASVRPSVTSEDFQDTVLAIANSVLRKLKPRGAGVFLFYSVGGKPALYDMRTNQFSLVHFQNLFNEMYAKDCEVLTWYQTLHDNVDVWTIWSKLLEVNIAYTPRRATAEDKGAFPLAFVRGSAALFIAVAPTADEAAVVKTQVDEILRQGLKEDNVEVEHSSFEDVNQRRIWCQGPRPEYRRETQRFNLPSRSIPLMRPKKDVIVLPGGYEPLTEFFNFCKEVLHLDDDQVIYTSGKTYNLDDDIDEEVVSKLKAIVGSAQEDHFALVPYSTTDNFNRWASQITALHASVIGDDAEWVKKFGHKGILHRHIRTPDQPSIIEELGVNVKVAKGYVCSTVEDLLDAYKAIGTSEVVIKPNFGAAGEGIIFVSEEEQLKLYDFPMGDVLLEEKLNLDKASDGIVLSPAVHYMESKLVGKALVDQIMVGTGYAGWRPSVAPKVFQDFASRLTRKLVGKLEPRGPGGFDFLSVEGEPILSDVNTGRFNGAHFPKIFREMYAPNKEYYVFKYKPPANLDIWVFWNRLLESNLAFIPGKTQSGVFPLIYLRGLSGQFIILADTMQICSKMHERTIKLLQKRGGPSVPKIGRAVQAVSAVSGNETDMILIKNAHSIFAPERLGVSNVLVGGESIRGLLDDETAAAMEPFCRSVIDARDMFVVPGFVDIHQHLIGGGGELGPRSRTPEAKLSEILEGGITTVIGVLGTDAVTRHLESLLAKTKAMNEDGITAYFWTGNYHLPEVSLMGSAKRDVALLDLCLGFGELAISDHRGSHSSVEELIKLVGDVRIGGMIGGKCGVTYCHMGHCKSRLQPLFEIVKQTDIPITSMLPTHMDKTPELVDEGIEWIKMGGYIDLTANAIATRKTIDYLCEKSVPMAHVMVSTDAYGSRVEYDDEGQPLRAGYAGTTGLLTLMRRLYFEDEWPMEDILPLVTSTPASFTKLVKKGTISVGKDADILLLDRNTLSLQYVIARGSVMKTPDSTRRGFGE